VFFFKSESVCMCVCACVCVFVCLCVCVCVMCTCIVCVLLPGSPTSFISSINYMELHFEFHIVLDLLGTLKGAHWLCVYVVCVVYDFSLTSRLV